MKGWYFNTTSNCEQKRDGELWTHSYVGKCAMIDSHAVKKEVKSHMPPGRNACALKDLEREHGSLYQQNLRSSRRKVQREKSSY